MQHTRTPIFLEKAALRPKIWERIDRYLALGRHHRLTVGFYHKGTFYVMEDGRGADALALQYDVGSISKTMTAQLVLQLVSRGLLALDARIDRYLPLPRGDYPTVYELLTHTAGYGHLTPAEFTVPSLLAHGYARKNIYEKRTSRDVLRALARRRKRRPVRYGYSDFPYAVLAVTAEHVTGEPFAALLERFLCEALGMRDTVILADPATRTPLATQKGRILPFWRWERENPYIAAGGLVSNVTDMLQYIAVQIESEAPFVREAHRFCEDSVSPKRNIATCTGFHTYKRSHQLWHVGGVGTFRSSLIFNRHRGFGVIVLGNAKGVSGANVHYLAKMLYSEFKNKRIKFSKVKEITDHGSTLEG